NTWARPIGARPETDFRRTSLEVRQRPLTHLWRRYASYVVPNRRSHGTGVDCDNCSSSSRQEAAEEQETADICLLHAGAFLRAGFLRPARGRQRSSRVRRWPASRIRGAWAVAAGRNHSWSREL